MDFPYCFAVTYNAPRDLTIRDQRHGFPKRPSLRELKALEAV
jgi:hypothetical protein